MLMAPSSPSSLSSSLLDLRPRLFPGPPVFGAAVRFGAGSGVRARFRNVGGVYGGSLIMWTATDSARLRRMPIGTGRTGSGASLARSAVGCFGRDRFVLTKLAKDMCVSGLSGSQMIFFLMTRERFGGSTSGSSTGGGGGGIDTFESTLTNLAGAETGSSSQSDTSEVISSFGDCLMASLADGDFTLGVRGGEGMEFSDGNGCEPDTTLGFGLDSGVTARGVSLSTGSFFGIIIGLGTGLIVVWPFIVTLTGSFFGVTGFGFGGETLISAPNSSTFFLGFRPFGSTGKAAICRIAIVFSSSFCSSFMSASSTNEI
uniref:(northern house mosquito) hypothetical protein n=1 Tax=Culex pipiens TaxID=7175 RepID=A0A8D8G616_CULPI